MLKLKNSGYGKKFRTEILNSSLKAFDKIIEDDRKGTKPMYRDRFWNFEERQKKKKFKNIKLVELRKFENKIYVCIICDTGTWQCTCQRTQKNGNGIK